MLAGILKQTYILMSSSLPPSNKFSGTLHVLVDITIATVLFYQLKLMNILYIVSPQNYMHLDHMDLSRFIVPHFVLF